jgi:hypothetical protein
MQQLIEWTNKATVEKLHPILAIASFVVTFLAIHPFQDNGIKLRKTRFVGANEFNRMSYPNFTNSGQQILNLMPLPFQDGNERPSRILTTLILLCAG